MKKCFIFILFEQKKNDQRNLHIDKMKRSYMSCFLHCIYFPLLTAMLQLRRSAWTLEVQLCPQNSVFQLLIYTTATISRFWL
jgi:hypothetical protein